MAANVDSMESEENFDEQYPADSEAWSGVLNTKSERPITTNDSK